MAMSSFYGGRQGASFVIVKRFDRVDVASDTVNKNVYYAVNGSGLLYYPFIERNGNNYQNYSWALITLDGQEHDVIYVNNGATGREAVDTVYLEGMRQCFEKGGDTVDIVNYGEYVIIDSLRDDPDNGKVYRRGMDFDYDPVTNPLAGAEYIGTIAGPKGDGVVFDIERYAAVDALDNKETREWTTAEEDLLPGKTPEGSYNDTIQGVWANVYNEAGDLVNYLIGFKFPYLVQEFDAHFRSPYDEDGIPITADADLVQRTDDGSHPYYERWQIDVPKGFQGDSQTEFATFPTLVKAGTTVYDTVDPETGALTGSRILDNDTLIRVASYFDTKDLDYVELNSTPMLYARLEDCEDWHFGYLQTRYDLHETGDHEWKDVNKYKVIDHVELNQNGIVKVLYTCDSPDELSEAIRWIWYDASTSTSGIQMADDGSVTVIYNTLDNGQRESQTHNQVITWITNMALNTNTGQFTVTFNNNKVKDAIIAAGGTWDDATNSFVVTLQWVKDVDMLPDGTLVFKRADDSTFTSTNKIKFVNSIDINTGLTPGSGSQKIRVTYNDGQPPVEIGNPINYIVESIVSEINDWGAPANHLLVWYSDPALRASITPTYTYKGIDDAQPKPGWVDIGYVKGEPGGIHIIGEVSSEDDLYKDGSAHTDPYTPEEIGGGGTPDDDFAGWVMSVRADPTLDPEIYAFDYNARLWYSLGAISSSNIDPSVVIKAGTITPTELNTGGMWIVTKTRLAAY